MKDQKCAIGVDLGGTKIQAALVGGSGEILKDLRLATKAGDGPEAVMEKVSGAVRELLQGTERSPAGLGVGVAGQLDPSGETVLFAPNLAWHDVPLQAALQRQLELPVVLINDVRAATWGEWLFGAGHGCDDLVCLFVGTGIGGGIVSAGRMLEGSSNTAGELGHITVDWHGPPCHCGNRGCLEALAGGWAIARRAREAVAADPLAGAPLKKMAHGREDAITAELVARAAQAGDPLAEELVAITAEALIAGTVGVVNAFNPGRLILGGGVLEGTPDLARRIERGVRARALQAACQDLQVLPAELHNHAGVIGAAALAMRRFGSQHFSEQEHVVGSTGDA
jgi:glucokinase